MPATLVWGKQFKLEETPVTPGQPTLEVVAIDGGHDMLSWSSVVELESLAEQHGVSRDIWPIYRNHEIESEIPLDDAVQRSAALRAALQKVDPGVIEGDYWLSFVWKLLREGHSFFVMT